MEKTDKTIAMVPKRQLFDWEEELTEEEEAKRLKAMTPQEYSDYCDDSRAAQWQMQYENMTHRDRECLRLESEWDDLLYQLELEDLAKENEARKRQKRQMLMNCVEYTYEEYEYEILSKYPELFEKHYHTMLIRDWQELHERIEYEKRKEKKAHAILIETITTATTAVPLILPAVLNFTRKDTSDGASTIMNLLHSLGAKINE